MSELNFFESIREGLEISRKTYLRSGVVSSDEQFVRTVDQAKEVLKILELIQAELGAAFAEIPGLESVFDREYGPYKDFTSRDNILDVCFREEYLFPEKQKCSMFIELEFNLELCQSYAEFFHHWKLEKIEDHNHTQEQIKNNFDVSIDIKSLKCPCYICLGEFRTKLRDGIFEECHDRINLLMANISEDIERKSIDQVSSNVYQAQKSLDRLLRSVRFKLRRSSVNKLEQQVKELLEENLSHQTKLGEIQGQKLKNYFSARLKEQGLRSDLVDDEEYQRFFKQQGLGLWKTEKTLLREFDRLVRSVLVLKRKDISANILRDYLGQFWLYSQARRMNRKVVYHKGPTNSGKTYHAINRLAEAQSGCYLAPLRLLAGELYDTLNARGIKTTLLTGEEVIEIKDARHYSSTVEMARLHEVFECCVIDEIQMITDPQRGWAWTRAFVNLQADEVHLCGDDSVLELVQKIVKLTGDELEVKEYERMTELKVMEKPLHLGSLKKGDALIVFSRRNALNYKADLEDLGFKVSIVYGRLSPEVRREQARKFDEEESDIIVSTDAISMGMNLPIKRIIFSSLSKFIDNKEIKISKSEIKQIAGRAGRYKRHPIGYVSCLGRVENGISLINDALKDDLPQKNKVMVGPDLDIFNQVNNALKTNSLPILRLSEFLQLFNTMTFQKPFYCVDLKEMIELAEIVEQADVNNTLSSAEIFGFACAPVNQGLLDHVQFFIYILNNFAHLRNSKNEEIDVASDNIDYLETSIKCVELYQWLARHFNNKFFDFNEMELLTNKGLAVDRLNGLLSEKIVSSCSSCGKKLDPKSKFNICEDCFQERRFRRRPPRSAQNSQTKKTDGAPKNHDRKRGTKKRATKKFAGPRVKKRNS